MRIKHPVVGLLVAVLCTSALAACGSSSTTTNTTSASAPSGASATTTAGSTTAGATTATSTVVSAGKAPIVFALDGMNIPGLDLLTGQTAGADAAANVINSEGGFGGRKVVVSVCNSMVAAAPTLDCAHKLLADNPVAMFGCELNWGLGALQLFASHQIPSFNCVNTTPDYTNPWNFGLSDGGFGDVRGMARWVCSQSDVKVYATIAADVPAEHVVIPLADSILPTCGKKFNIVYFPPTATDYGPYVQKLLQFHPDFVQIQAPAPTSGLQILHALNQAKFPSNKIGIASSGFDQTDWQSAGSVLNGVYMQLEFDNWDNTSNPDVAAYLKAMQGSSQSPYSVNPQWGYNSVMWFYTVAKQLGFDKFTSLSLANFMRTQNGVAIPISRQLVNPGPKTYPQVKQPYTQIVQWNSGKFTTVMQGTQQGWVYGY
jgi:Periplasmic binding protein